MKAKFRLFIIAVVLVNVSACSSIKNLFPDKEKDYQFTTEIPPLVLPPDLAGDSIIKAPVAITSPTETANIAPASYTTPVIDRKLIQIERVDEARRLHIGAPLTMVWRRVGKALSRKSIEVTNHNQDEGLFRIQYDPNKQDVEDGSLWDEVIFVLNGFEVTEQEYALKLVENNQQTDVIILDKEQKPVTDEASLSLLTLLYDTIKESEK